METKLLRRLRRLARRRIKVRYVSKDIITITYSCIEPYTLYMRTHYFRIKHWWNRIAEVWDIKQCKINAHNLQTEYKKAVRQFILDKVHEHKKKREERENKIIIKQFNKDLRKHYR